MTASSVTTETLIQAETEPPLGRVGVPEEDEPPSKRGLNNRFRFFGHVPDADWNDWKWQFRHRITTVEELNRYIPLSSREQAELKLVISKYPFSVTPYYLSLIHPEDQNDPIRKQAVPCFEEITMADMGEEDPLEEKRDSVVPGLVHRYPDRVLMVLTVFPCFLPAAIESKSRSRDSNRSRKLALSLPALLPSRWTPDWL